MTFPLVPPANGVDKGYEGDERTRTAASVLTPEKPKAPHAGIIYVIQSTGGGPVKIGYCDSHEKLQSRLKTLQTGNPAKLHVVHVEDAPRSRELDLHRKFERDRLVGEWFTPTAKLSERFPHVAYEYSDVTPLSMMYDLGFDDGWHRGFDDAAECELCGERLCDCPDTKATRERAEKIETSLIRDRYYALHGSTRGMKSRDVSWEGRPDLWPTPPRPR